MIAFEGIRRRLRTVMLDLLLNKAEKYIVPFSSTGYLCEIGWIESMQTNLPVDKHIKPIPWVTYSFIDFIDGRLLNSMSIFEYGAGNSTLYFAHKVRKVTTVEHDYEWYKNMKGIVPANVDLRHEPLEYGGNYSRTVNNQTEKFDLVIVDGRDRNNCIKNSITSINDRGVIVLDDSERPNYAEAIDFLYGQSYRKIDFTGIAPCIYYRKTTSVFYRADNCLGI